MTCAEIAAAIDTTNGELQVLISERDDLNTEISDKETELMSLWMQFWYQCSGGAAVASEPVAGPAGIDGDLSEKARQIVDYLQRAGFKLK